MRRIKMIVPVPVPDEALRLFAEDELSSVKWLRYACAALNAPVPGAQASA